MDGFSPQTIIDQPIPLLGGGFTDSTGNTSNPVSNSDAIAPTTQLNEVFPSANIAQETISQSLNTETKAILGPFTFEQLGAIVIGAVNAALGTGQINISPDGIVAQNSAGTTTFSLNGQTGDATFLGQLIAGSIITGAISVGANNVTIDGANKRIIINDGSNDRIVIGYLAGGF